MRRSTRVSIKSEAEARDYYHYLRDQLFHDLNDWQHRIDAAEDRAIEKPSGQILGSP
jgi:hypothetical protein